MSIQLSSPPQTHLSDTHTSKSISNGRWTSQEHQLFLQGINKYGNNWKKIEQMIETRNGSQIRSHAQKYYNKANKSKDEKERKESVGHQELDTCLTNSHCLGSYPEISDLDRLILAKSFIKDREQGKEEREWVRYLEEAMESCFDGVKIESGNTQLTGNSFVSYFSEQISAAGKIDSTDFCKIYVDLERSKKIRGKEETTRRSGGVSFVPYQENRNQDNQVGREFRIEPDMESF